MKVCHSLPCMLRGSDVLLEAVEEATCCKMGELSEDGMFGVDIVQCQGACANAPVIAVDDDYYVSWIFQNSNNKWYRRVGLST